MKYLVTGGAGFIGSNIANDLARRGGQVVALDNLFLGTKRNLDPGVEFIERDVLNPRLLREASKELTGSTTRLPSPRLPCSWTSPKGLCRWASWAS